ncbi:hypothetical protein [Streptomyces sp. NPDC002533]
MEIRKRFAAITMTVALAGTGLIVGSTPASAATCYGSAHSFNKPDGKGMMPYLANNYFMTTSNCADINIKTSSNTKVAICFYHRDGSYNYCQNTLKEAKAGVWATIATNVKDGVLFRYNFNGGAFVSGQWAA